MLRLIFEHVSEKVAIVLTRWGLPLVLSNHNQHSEHQTTVWDSYVDIIPSEIH